jgi:hypothetical protein
MARKGWCQRACPSLVAWSAHQVKMMRRMAVDARCAALAPTQPTIPTPSPTKEIGNERRDEELSQPAGMFGISGRAGLVVAMGQEALMRFRWAANDGTLSISSSGTLADQALEQLRQIRSED